LFTDFKILNPEDFAVVLMSEFFILEVNHGTHLEERVDLEPSVFSLLQQQLILRTQVLWFRAWTGGGNYQA